MSRILISAAVVALLTAPVVAQQQKLAPQIFSEASSYSAANMLPPEPLWVFEDDVTLDFYGYVRLDMQFNDSRMNDPSIPFVVMSEDASPPVGAPASRLANADDSEFTLSPRLTRVGMSFSGDDLINGIGNPKLSGKVESDFYNIGLGDSDSRQSLRLRLAYLDFNWGEWSVRAGQDWDVISPLYPAVNHDLLMWGAGNTGDRRPQITARNVMELGDGALHTAAGIALTGAVGGAAVQGGLRSGENSGRPMVHARVGYHGKSQSGGKYQLGLWAHNSEEEFDATGVGSEQSYDSSSFGVDLVLPVYEDSIWVKGEFYTGSNTRDIRGGILQGVNGTTGKEIDSSGGWVELGWKATDKTTMFLGYAFDDPEDADLAAYSWAKNTVPYAAAHWRSEDFLAAIEVLLWETEYIGLESGDALRVVGWVAYYF